MIERVSYKLSRYITNNDDEKIEVCKYGLELIISTSIILTTILVLSLFLNCLISSVMFIVFFYILRKFAGGTHANSYLGCFIISTVICMLSALMSRHISKNYFILIFTLVTFLSIYTIFKYAPIAHINKPLGKVEFNKYRKLSRMALIFELTLILILFLLLPEANYIYNAAIIAVFIESVTLIKLKEGRDKLEKIIIHEKN